MKVNSFLSRQAARLMAEILQITSRATRVVAEERQILNQRPQARPGFSSIHPGCAPVSPVPRSGSRETAKK
jgi:hypothetical protein